MSASSDSISSSTLAGTNRNRTAISVGIMAYLGLLIAGVVMHTFDTVGKNSAPAYLIVWDMFCGWNSYERRLHFIAEGESGTYYDASEVPSRVITPHGPTARRHFDFHNQFTGRMAAGVLARTSHEPIRRVFVVEEHWPKRFNLPASLRGDAGLKEKTSYWHTQAVYSPDGELVQAKPLWAATQRQKSLFDNPRIRAAADRNRTYFAVNE